MFYGEGNNTRMDLNGYHICNDRSTIQTWGQKTVLYVKNGMYINVLIALPIWLG